MGWDWSHPTSLQHPQPGSMKQRQASLHCCSCKATLTVAVCMIMIVKIFLLDSNMLTRVSDASPCIYFYTSIYVSTLLVVFLLRLVPFCTWNNLHQGTTDPHGSDCIPWWQRFPDIGPVVPVRLGNTIEKGLGVSCWCWTFTGFIGPTGTTTVLVRGHGFFRS